MTKKIDTDRKADELRKQAEKIARHTAGDVPEDLEGLSPASARKLLHKLRVHQVELEMQNEELRRAQEKLEESRAQYFELYDLAPVGYFSINEKGMILEANLTAARLLGVPARDLRTQPFSIYVLKEDKDIYYLHRRKLFESRSPQRCELRMLHRDGSTFWVVVEAAVAGEGKSGDPVCLTTVSDITSRKKAEDAQRESEEKYHLLVENAQESVFVAVGGIIRYCNSRTSALSGYSQEELFARPFTEFIHPDDRQMVAERHLQRLRGMDVPNIYSFRIVCKAGDIKWVDISAALINWEDGPATLNFLTDVTDRRRLEEERQRVAKLESVGLLAGGIAHDFNNILTAIVGNISLARMEAVEGSEMKGTLEEAQKAALRAKDLTGQLLTFSRGGVPVRKLAPLGEMLKDTADFALRGSNVKGHFSIPPDLWHAEVDIGQVSQVIHNLVINAQQSMPGGGILEIAAENITLDITRSIGRGPPLKEGNYVRIAVADHGSGISADDMNKIFDPFFTTKRDGGGLGLATSFSIARNHGGHISVESQTGAGSTFYLYLPASRETVAVGNGKESAVRPTTRSRILVMDDEKAVREVAGRMLRHLGYEDIVLAGDGSEAVRLFREAIESGDPFKAVILDLTVPGGMGGEVTIKHLLTIDPAVRAILSSGYAADSVIANYREYGFCGMVAKPYTPEEFGKALLDVLG